MDAIEPPDSYHLSAAVGWLELGNPAEAAAELARLLPRYSDHPDVLEVTWAILAEQQNWEQALDAARRLLQSDPQRPSGWLHQAYALRRVTGGGLKAAWDALLPAADAFPQEPTIPYNLACYACQLGDCDSARKWLKCALKCGDKRCVKKMALTDPDLKPLWDEISSW